MELELDGSGLPEEYIEAMASGLATMGVNDTPVVLTDHFVAQVRRRTGESDYSTSRGVGVVAARTLIVGPTPTIVVNAPAITDRSINEVERLLAHESGHVLLSRRGEDSSGNPGLVESSSQKQMLGIASLAIEEFRIEKALAGMGYSASDMGVIGHLDQAMYWLNCELIEAVCDPQSGADPRHLLRAVVTSQDWLSKNLAYLAAYHPGGVDLNLSELSAYTRANWADYLGADWPARVAIYSSVPDVLEGIERHRLDRLLLQGMELETALLRALGFYFTESAQGTAFYRDSSNEMRWDARVQRAMAETQQRQSA